MASISSLRVQEDLKQNSSIGQGIHSNCNSSLTKTLYLSGWSVDALIKSLIKLRKLNEFVLSLSSDERLWFVEAV
ncbi:MAG: hypothetical protein LM582_05420 [Desulfurococcaceae archaeon]|nr:hypothetical protein [Desulfurococcaceae archaeon]